MIIETTGDILKANTEAIINPVNCTGVMGKGLALQIKSAYLYNFTLYKNECDNKRIKVGEVFTVDLKTTTFPNYIINFPTKDHWRDNSQLIWIETGLSSLLESIKKFNIKSIAIPPLGCGLGGLEWSVVKPVIIKAFENIDVEVYLYEPFLGAL